jgi:hypothetical protein
MEKEKEKVKKDLKEFLDKTYKPKLDEIEKCRETKDL